MKVERIFGFEGGIEYVVFVHGVLKHVHWQLSLVSLDEVYN